MKFGLMFWPTASSIPPREIALAAEDFGFESLWFTEHTHIPINRASVRPFGGELGEEYAQLFDSFIALAAAASATNRLRVATGICIVPQHDTLVLAKQVATLDHLSAGRFIFGIGAGWNREEMVNHGVDFVSRWELMRERIEALKTIWRETAPEYHGRFVSFDPIWLWPKPLQRPHPPIVLAGDGPHVLSRVVRYADGWLTNRRAGGDLSRRVEELRRLTSQAGRNDIPVTAWAAREDERELRELAEAGVERCIFRLPGDRTSALGRLEGLAGLAKAFN